MTSLSEQIVSGWQIRREGQTGWQPIAVPGCWEDAGFPAQDPGPYWYRTTLEIPQTEAGQRLWLRFGAVSYHCDVWVNGREVGTHTGAWDPFEVEISRDVSPGEPAELLLRVEKPASLVAGPDSPSLPGRYPLRQTLSGFLPYVWGHAFGGIWQHVTLATSGPRRLGTVRVRGEADGRTWVSGECSASGPVLLGIRDPAGSLTVEEVLSDSQFAWSGRLPDPQPWSPERPALYTACLRLPDGDERRVRFGLRSLKARGAALYLNRQPIYPRLALSWGWYPDRRCPNPPPERVRADLMRLRAMGYNGVKLCLWFPPPFYFDLADELGMILWLELPMWLPEPSPFFYAQTRLEYSRLVSAACNHPSLLLYTLGCELNRSVEAGFLRELYAQTRALAGNALVRDNSGSGEAYGGWLEESADFYDNHFYCDPHFLRPLLDAFAPSWRESKPWLMGEFCDYDTLRDLPSLLRSAGGRPPWWMASDPDVNPQGARWEMRVTRHVEALQASGPWERSDELIQASYRQGLLHRKLTLEAVRARPELSGYVVTGEVDTPVSTAGMWTDLYQPKFDADRFRSFNDDLVLLVGWDRRRAWVAGGDRPAPADPYNIQAGTTIRAHLLASNYSRLRGWAQLEWQVGCPGEPPLLKGTQAVRLVQGRVHELAVLEFQAPVSLQPFQLVLQAQLRVAQRSYANEWPLWVYPPDPWCRLPRFGLFDPLGLLADLVNQARDWCRRWPAGSLWLAADAPLPATGEVLVCTAWTRDLDQWVRSGGRALLLQDKAGPPGPLPVVECPFWREAVKWIEPHPAWRDFPHQNEPGLQFYSLAPDCALDASARGEAAVPLFRRLDARSLAVHEYAALLDWGRGRLIATTLRFQGGFGDQAAGICRNPAAMHLLAVWLQVLHASEQTA